MCLKKSIILFLAVASMGVIGCSASKITNVKPGQQPQVFSKEVSVKLSLDYLLYLPKEYGKEKKQWPLVLFLHGSGERGSDVNLVAKHGPPMLAQQGKDFPFILVSPQCPQDYWWNMDSQVAMLDGLLKDIQDKYDVDPSRVYITGLSMGGYGTWKMLEVYPDRFAAAVPVCGGGDSTKACLYKNVPIWVFHGAKDNVVPLVQSSKMIDALKACGGSPKFTVYPEAQHNSWTETYNNPEVFEWMLKQVKK